MIKNKIFEKKSEFKIVCKTTNEICSGIKNGKMEERNQKSKRDVGKEKDERKL